MGTVSDNETWLIEAGDAVVALRAASEGSRLSARDRLIYCLWVADYGMRNAGDFEAALDLHADFQSEAVRLAEEMRLKFTVESFSLSAAGLQSEYFARFDRICDEVRRS